MADKIPYGYRYIGDTVITYDKDGNEIQPHAIGNMKGAIPVEQLTKVFGHLKNLSKEQNAPKSEPIIKDIKAEPKKEEAPVDILINGIKQIIPKTGEERVMPQDNSSSKSKGGSVEPIESDYFDKGKRALENTRNKYQKTQDEINGK